MSKKIALGRYLSSTMLTGVAAVAAAPAFAQDEGGDDEIVVTGSRIARQDLSAPSPVATVDAEQLVLTNTVNSEEYLDALPQVIPSFDSTSNNPGTGTATVSLRGLGTNRTLVLVDGMRFVGSGAGGPVDLNNIPSSLVDRVEVVTGGASAVYGSDAIAGVVNFILKDDFEGVQLDVSDRLSAAGWDANVFNAALTLGGNFADGKGNAVFSASYTNRKALFQGDRAFSEFTFFDPGAGSTSVGFIPGGSSSIPGTRFRGNGSSNFGTGNGTAIDPLCAGNTCSGLFAPGPNLVRGLRFGNPNDLYNYAPTNYLQLPQERYSIFGAASYEVSDNIEVYARGVFANAVVDQQLAPTPAGFFVAVPKSIVDSLNPALGAIMQAHAATAGCTGGGATLPGVVPNPAPGLGTYCFTFNKRFEELGTRNSLRDTNTFQISGGVKVDLNDNWVWDTGAQFGRSSIYTFQSGNVSISALRTALQAGANIYDGPGSLSPADAATIGRTGAIADIVEQTQIISTLTGELGGMKMPWAESAPAVSLGVEYREEFAQSIPDSVLGPDVLGFNQAPAAGGRFDVYEAFLETDIPIFENTGIGDFSINGAYRYSDYSIANVGSTHTYAVGGSWEPVDGLRFRAQYQHAVRAPNIGELFTAISNGFPGAKDPCSGGGFGGFSAATIVATCVATGVPPGLVGTPFQSNGQIEALFGGNPNLSEETANTLTVGMVWEPSFVDNLTLIVDFYNIKVRDAIATVGLGTILDSCHINNVASACALVVRNPLTGEIASPFLMNLGASNIAFLQAKGIEAQVNYGFDIGSLGSMNFVYFGNYYLKNGYDPIDGYIECTGLYSGDCGEPTPTYKHTLTAGWDYGPLTTSVRWRLIGGLDYDVVGTCGSTTSCISDLSDDIGMFNYLDVTMRYSVNENLDLTVGVQNITGKDAPILGSTVSEQANTFPATYDTLGRQLFFGASLRF
ncbi:MAG: TonB-dependent receptor [Parvularculaceae bacterium]|nr:TonB-dependent receptor [Parvularculaceae bacterium]